MRSLVLAVATVFYSNAALAGSCHDGGACSAVLKGRLNRRLCSNNPKLQDKKMKKKNSI
jgi:hypothetical protein